MTTHGRSTVKKLKVHFQIKIKACKYAAKLFKCLWPIHTIHTARHTLFAFRSSLFVIRYSPFTTQCVIPNPISFQLQQVSSCQGRRSAGGWLVGRVFFFFFFGIFWRMTAPEGGRRPELRRYWNCNCNCDYFTWHPCHAAQWGEHVKLNVGCFINIIFVFYILNILQHVLQNEYTNIVIYH